MGGMGRTPRALLAFALLAAVTVSCGDDDGDSAATASAGTVATSAAPTTSIPTTEAPPTEAPPTTGDGSTTAATTASATTSTTTEPTYPTTTEHQVPDDCDVEAMYALVDADLAAARLAPGGEWSTDTEGVAFDERTHDAEEFRYRMGLDCLVRAVQRTDAGDERLLLAAWTGVRNAYVVQATDGPSSPYVRQQRFQLFIEWPYGEWIEDQFVWAGEMEGGETVVVGADDAPVAVAAKSWQSEVPRFEDLPVTLDAERYGIDLLLHAGARNVSVAEPPGFGSELSALQMITPLGLHLIPTIGPIGWFDPAAELFPGEQTVETIEGVDVYVTRGSPDAYAVASVGWKCDGYVWYIDAVWGTVDELVDWARTMIQTSPCGV